MEQKYLFLFFSFLYLFFPQFSLGFSEEEIDSLQSSGEKRFSANSLRTQINFSLSRNLDIRSNLENNIADPDTEASLLDPSVLYYGLGLTLNYSLGAIAERFKYDILKNIEVFLSSSFNSSFLGHRANEEDYNLVKYTRYALGDIVGGFTTPVYKSDDLLGYFNFSAVLFPLSRISKEATLFTTVEGAVSLIYFLQKKEKWNLSLSSSHALAYNQYTNAASDKAGFNKNIFTDTNHGQSLIYRQSYYNFLPSSTTISASHYLGMDTSFSQYYFLALSSSFSWKLRKRLYLNFLVRWKDGIFIHNFSDETIRKIEPPRFNSLTKTFFSLSGSYSF